MLATNINFPLNNQIPSDFCDNLPIFSLQDLRDDEIVQTSPLLQLETRIIEKILEFIPLKERLLITRKVCRKFAESSIRSVKSVAFFRDQLDSLDDVKIRYFLSIYGSQIEYLNYDLYKSIGLSTQWSWRQSVIQTVTKCTQLRHLDVLVCNRHRLRDGDLSMIFKHCHNLETLKLDGRFIIGHCFVKAPLSLRRLEIELCYRFTQPFFIVMLSRLQKLKVLHVSQLHCLCDKIVSKIVGMRELEQLSIVGDSEKIYDPCRFSDLQRLKKLKTLCLEGLNLVTDKMLTDICDDTKSQLAFTLEHVSLAHCQNISSNGIQKLAGLKHLKSLNLDGVSKRDISMGIEEIGRKSKIERVLLSENTFVTSESVYNLIRTSEKTLRIVDISNNKHLTESRFAKQLGQIRSSTKRCVVLTDNEEMWKDVEADSSRQLEIVYLYRSSVNSEWLSQNYPAISTNGPHQLATGVLMPDLRRGNRYRLIEMEMNRAEQTTNEENIVMDEQENQAFTEMMTSWANGAEFEFFDSSIDFNSQLIADFSNLNMFNIMNSFNFSNEIVDSVASKEDFLNVLTVGSGGAPRPPDTMEVKTLSPKLMKYTRANRPQRKARKEKKKLEESAKVAKAQPQPPVFTDDDFPPLG